MQRIRFTTSSVSLVYLSNWMSQVKAAGRIMFEAVTMTDGRYSTRKQTIPLAEVSAVAASSASYFYGGRALIQMAVASDDDSFVTYVAVVFLPESGLQIAEEEVDEVGNAGEGGDGEEVDEDADEEDAEAVATENLLPAPQSIPQMANRVIRV